MPPTGEAFLLPAAEIVGAPAELLSGKEEGQLSYAGATADLPPGGGDVVVLDIGGGSTEIVTKVAGEIRAVSLDIGCVRLTERFLHDDPPATAEIAAAVHAIGSELDRAVEAIPLLGDTGTARRLVGLAGTVSTLASLEAGAGRLRPEQDPSRGVDGTDGRALVRGPGSRTAA